MSCWPFSDMNVLRILRPHDVDVADQKKSDNEGRYAGE